MQNYSLKLLCATSFIKYLPTYLKLLGDDHGTFETSNKETHDACVQTDYVEFKDDKQGFYKSKQNNSILDALGRWIKYFCIFRCTSSDVCEAFRKNTEKNIIEGHSQNFGKNNIHSQM